MYDQSIILFAIGLEICDLSATYESHTKNVHREEWSRKNGSIRDIYKGTFFNEWSKVKSVEQMETFITNIHLFDQSNRVFHLIVESYRGISIACFISRLIKFRECFFNICLILNNFVFKGHTGICISFQPMWKLPLNYDSSVR